VIFLLLAGRAVADEGEGGTPVAEPPAGPVEEVTKPTEEVVEPTKPPAGEVTEPEKVLKGEPPERSPKVGAESTAATPGPSPGTATQPGAGAATSSPIAAAPAHLAAGPTQTTETVNAGGGAGGGGAGKHHDAARDGIRGSRALGGSRSSRRRTGGAALGTIIAKESTFSTPAEARRASAVRRARATTPPGAPGALAEGRALAEVAPTKAAAAKPEPAPHSSSPLDAAGHAVSRTFGGPVSLMHVLLFLILGLTILAVGGFVWIEARAAEAGAVQDARVERPRRR
jgi:hypothetical protein